MRFRMMKTLSVFNRCSVDDRRKRMEKCAFANENQDENALVWTGPEINRNARGLEELDTA